MRYLTHYLPRLPPCPFPARRSARHLQCAQVKKGLSQIEIEDQVTSDLHRAMGVDGEDGGKRRLNRVLQLTGFSDPVYAEAYVTVHQYDVVMDVTVVNRTPDTLQVRS